MAQKRSYRIIVVLVEPPAPMGDAAARWYYVLVKGLQARGHRVAIFSGYSDERQVDMARSCFPEDEFDLRFYPHEQAGSFKEKLRHWQRPQAYLFSNEMKADLSKLFHEGFDILHLEQIWSGWVGMDFPWKALVNIHHLSSIDLAGESSRSWRSKLNNRLCLETEANIIQSYKYFRASTPRLVRPIRRSNGNSDVFMVPLGLDFSLYEFVDRSERPKQPRLTLIGKMTYPPSYHAAVRLLEKIWPLVHERVPDAKLRIVGWEARSALKDYLDQPAVEIIENVEDIRPFFADASVLLYAPDVGSGMKIKVLEAMAYGLPVVTSSIGIEGLPAEHGIHALLGEDNAELADHAVALLSDGEKQEALRTHARRLVERECEPEKVLCALERIYHRMTI